DEHPLPARPQAERVSRALSRAAVAPRGRARGRRGAVAAALPRALVGGHRGRDRRIAPRARGVRGAVSSSFIARRPVRVIGGVVVTGLCVAYILWQIDVGQTLDVLRNAQLEYFFAAIGIMAGSVWPMAWRWKQLLRARGVHERLLWLVRAYFTSYTVGQVLPASIGGHRWRMYETTKRHPGHGGPIAGSVLIERVLGGVATLILAAIGFALAVGEYDVGGYLSVELAFVILAIVLGFALFSRRARKPLARLLPLVRRLKLERP